jgi:hypothetical protein
MTGDLIVLLPVHGVAYRQRCFRESICETEQEI